MDFNVFKVAVQEQIERMSTHNLYEVNTTKEALWETYLTSFPEGTNPIFRERTEHDCSCCRQFISTIGGVVAIIDDKLESIWDINIGGYYQVVADALSSLVKSKPIIDPFLHYSKVVGTDYNIESTASAYIKWEHFFTTIPKRFVRKEDAIARHKGEARSRVEVFKRALDEITPEAVEITLELMEQNSLARGAEHLRVVSTFKKMQDKYLSLTTQQLKEFYVWEHAKGDSVTHIRNSVIGTLLVDLSSNIHIDTAVHKYNSKVDPLNYKRPKAVVTKRMLESAQKVVEELGIEPSLYRRYACIDDITANNVLFVNRDTRATLGLFDTLKQDIGEPTRNYDNVEEISLNKFITDIMPKCTTIEVLLDNSHEQNLVSLIAPENPDAPNILKWGNNFSWSYNGEVADAMKARVEKAGGNIIAEMRYSIQWNDGDNNQNDFDAWCIEPGGNKIFYPSKGQQHNSSGMLDVDIIRPGHNVAVENITWVDKSRMPIGRYIMAVHNYSHNGGTTGFTAQIEVNGVIHNFTYKKGLIQNEVIEVAEVNFNGETFVVVPKIEATSAPKTIWGLRTQSFHSVSVIMKSPNFWDDQVGIGNQHVFFMLKDCINDTTARGFYNEFLAQGLDKHRKVFEYLGAKTRVADSQNQLSGLGFSTTVQNSIVCKVTGAFTRILKINIK